MSHRNAASTCRSRQGRLRQPLVDYLTVKFILTFVENWHDRWAETALGELRRLGLNTVGNWSQWEIAREAGYPYVRPLSLEFPGTETVYCDFPDVFADSFADVELDAWTERLTDAAREELAAFSEMMVDEFYRVLSEACRAVDPNHLNFGTRYAYVIGDWALAEMSYVDIFSINCYEDRELAANGSMPRCRSGSGTSARSTSVWPPPGSVASKIRRSGPTPTGRI